MYGWIGKVLKVDLTKHTIEVEEHDERFYRKYLGGSNVVAYYLLKEIPKGIDAFDPENRIVVATSVLTGTPVAGCGRHSMGCLSPLTGGMANSEAGGHFGPELKFAGFDAIVISGRAEKPCYLWVQDGKAEICDGAAVWGKTTGEVQQIIRDDYLWCKSCIYRRLCRNGLHYF